MTPDSPFQPIGRFLILLGVAIAAVGLIMLLLDRFGIPGRLPGDFVFRGKQWSIWIPVASSLILSVVLTILLNLFRR
jgi:hypothetical protein